MSSKLRSAHLIQQKYNIIYSVSEVMLIPLSANKEVGLLLLTRYKTSLAGQSEQRQKAFLIEANIEHN